MEIKTRYDNWFARMCEYGFTENEDYILVVQKRTTNNPKNPITEYIDHAITINMGKEISMIQRTERGQQARRYFIACESKLKEVLTKQLPQDYISALKALVRSEEEKALMQPQVDYYQRVLNPNAVPEMNGFIKYVTTTAIAKDLQMSAQKLNKMLNELHIIYKQGKTWFLYAEHENKIPEHADYEVNEWGQTLKFTEKGREWIIQLLKDNNLINVDGKKGKDN